MQSKMLLCKLVSQSNHYLVEKLNKLKDLSYNVIYVGNNIQLLITKLNYVNNVDIILYLKYHIQFKQMVKSISIVRKTGNQIKRFSNGNNVNTNNNKKLKSIRNQKKKKYNSIF
jgi:hypothetical protein